MCVWREEDEMDLGRAGSSYVVYGDSHDSVF